MRSSRTRRGTLGRRHSLLVEAPETAEPAGSAQTSSSGNGCLVRGPVAGLKPTTALASAVANDRTCVLDYLVLSCSAAPGASCGSARCRPSLCDARRRQGSANEIIRPAGEQIPESTFPELTMLLFLHGRERTDAEFCQLLDSAGLRMHNVTPTALNPPNIRALTTSVYGSFSAQ